MENFIVSARKYRPITFDTVVGQQTITNTLKNAIRNQQLAQSFLFCGPRGVGKTTCARILAKTINCENLSETLEPCNTCTSCKAFSNSASFNIHELDAASNNSVDDIRSLVEQVRIPPQMGKYKVYIIDEVHMLSQAAFNAFLKTLEEPPAYAKFILATTEKHKIIPTILSRCQIFDFKRITLEDISKHLGFVANSEGVEADPEALHIIAQKADGALRDALTIFDQMVNLGERKITRQLVIDNLNVLDYDYYFKVVDAMLHGNYQLAILILNEILDKGFEGQHFIAGLGDHLRNLLMCKDRETVKLMEVSHSIRNKYAEQSAEVPVNMLVTWLDLNNKCDINYRTSNFKKLSLEVALITMSQQSKPLGETSHTTPQPAQPVPKPQITESSHQQPIGTTTAPESVTQPQSSNHNPPLGIQEIPASSLVSDSSPAAPVTDAMPKESPSVPTPRIPSAGTSMHSLKDLKKSVDKVSQGSIQKKTESPRNNPFDKQKLIQAFTEYAGRIKDNSTLLYTALTAYIPEVSEDYTISMKVGNTILEKELNDASILFLDYLRNTLSNDLITINIVVSEIDESEAKKFLSDKEKLDLLISKNPEINNLKSQLNLELDLE